jgi:hypothetical protein
MSSFPDLAMPTHKAPDEPYATLDALLEARDVLACDIRMPWWRDKTGRPYVLRVRGLSALDETFIVEARRIAALTYAQAHPNEPIDPDALPAAVVQAEYTEILVRAILEPRLNHDQARKLLRKNTRAISELVRFIVALNTFSSETLMSLAEQWDALLLTGHTLPGAPTPDPSPRTRGTIHAADILVVAPVAVTA